MGQAIKKITSAFLMLTIFGHLFCCVLPLVMTFTSLSASLGLVAVNSPLIDLFAQYEGEIFFAAGMLILITGLLQYISGKTDCHDTGCGHGSCEPKKQWSHTLFKIASVIYLLNLFIFLAFPHIH